MQVLKGYWSLRMEGVESKSQSQGWDTQIMAENVEGKILTEHE